MSLSQKLKTKSYCVGGRHYSGTNNISGAITSKGFKMLRVIVLSVREISQ